MIRSRLGHLSETPYRNTRDGTTKYNAYHYDNATYHNNNRRTLY